MITVMLVGQYLTPQREKLLKILNLIINRINLEKINLNYSYPVLTKYQLKNREMVL